MILELNGTKVTIVDKTLGYQGDNLVNTIQVTVDKDSTWNYKLDMYKGKSKCFDPVLMTREGNVCTVQLTNEILSYGGRYIFQLRGYTDTQTYHSDIFESWVNTSIEYQYDCKQTDCGCDCKLPTEFYQVEDNVTEINNHPPYPGDSGKWMIWDVNKHEYVESDIEVISGGEEYQTKANLTTSVTAQSTDIQYPSAKATYDYGQSIAKSAGKIDAITVNDVEQIIDNKTAKIVVDKSTVGLNNVDNTSDINKPVSTAQATAIADAKKAGTDAQAAVANLAEATQTALNTKLAKSDVVAVTLSATAGQAADAKSVYDAIEAAKPDIVTPTAESTDTQAASAKAVWDMIGTGGSGTDISLGLTGASVGDIVKVKAVDDSGKPTAWEAAAQAELEVEQVYETLFEVEEAVESVEYDFTDEVGNPIMLKEVEIVQHFISTNVSGTDTTIKVLFEDDSIADASIANNYANAAGNWVSAVSVAKVLGKTVYAISNKKTGSNGSLDYMGNISKIGAATVGGWGDRWAYNPKNIKGIIGMKIPGAVGAKSQFYIYGVKA